MHLTSHTIVCNEEQWIWYALQSVAHIVDHYIVFDTGSTDKTNEIIQAFISANPNKKITYEKKGKVSTKELVLLRNEQLELTKNEWFLLLDGDEIWPQKSIKEVENITSNATASLSAIYLRALVPVGDLFHLQNEKAGKYKIGNHSGHLNIRLYRKRVGWKWIGIYPHEAYCDEKGIPVQQKESELHFLATPYWHLTHLYRSSVDTHRKYKLEIGKSSQLFLPEVFFSNRPDTVSDPWVQFTKSDYLRAVAKTPLIKLKRIIVS